MTYLHPDAYRVTMWISKDGDAGERLWNSTPHMLPDRIQSANGDTFLFRTRKEFDQFEPDFASQGMRHGSRVFDVTPGVANGMEIVRIVGVGQIESYIAREKLEPLASIIAKHRAAGGKVIPLPRKDSPKKYDRPITGAQARAMVRELTRTVAALVRLGPEGIGCEATAEGVIRIPFGILHAPDLPNVAFERVEQDGEIWLELRPE